jgi:hypothetical protein
MLFLPSSWITDRKKNKGSKTFALILGPYCPVKLLEPPNHKKKNKIKGTMELWKTLSSREKIAGRKTKQNKIMQDLETWG